MDRGEGRRIDQYKELVYCLSINLSVFRQMHMQRKSNEMLDPIRFRAPNASTLDLIMWKQTFVCGFSQSRNGIFIVVCN